MNIHKVIGKLPRPKREVMLPYLKYTGLYNPLDEHLYENEQSVPAEESYNAVGVISMRHDICYRGTNTKEGK